MNHLGTERWIGIGAGLAVGLAVLYILYGPRIPDGFFDSLFSSPPEAVAEAEAEPAPEPAAEPAPAPAPAPKSGEQVAKYPLPAPPAPAPAPEPQAKPVAELPPSQDVAAADADVRTSAAQVFGTPPVESFLVPDRVIQNFVATVDSLDREPIPLRFRVVGNVPEVPVVEKKGDKIYLHSDNDERYRMLAEALRATDSRSIASLYIRYYPLLQRAYREMGYPGQHFNDRLVQVIDHLLQTPTVEHPIELVRGKVLYHYADPALEELSSGQKLLIRIGPANATTAKQRLRELRAHLTSGQQLPMTAATQRPPPAEQPSPVARPAPAARSAPAASSAPAIPAADAQPEEPVDPAADAAAAAAMAAPSDGAEAASADAQEPEAEAAAMEASGDEPELGTPVPLPEPEPKQKQEQEQEQEPPAPVPPLKVKD